MKYVWTPVVFLLFVGILMCLMDRKNFFKLKVRMPFLMFFFTFLFVYIAFQLVAVHFIDTFYSDVLTIMGVFAGYMLGAKVSYLVESRVLRVQKGVKR